MNVAEIERLLQNSREVTLRQVDGEWIEITTLYLDRHNDALQIYVRAENGGYLLTDDSYAIHDLEASGCSLQPKRKDLLRTALNGFDVTLEGDALEVHATAETFPLKMGRLLVAVLTINSLLYLAKRENE